MAQNAPPSQDVQDVQFKLHDKFSIFVEGNKTKSLVSLLAVSSAKGLIFVGNPNSNELKVLKLDDVVNSKTAGHKIKSRVVNLPGEPNVLACSSDGSMLAVNYVLNNTGFLQIYEVDSFVSPAVNTLYNLPVAPVNNIFALQLLWNPVIANNIALILTDGSVAMYTLNNGGQYDKTTLGKEHQVKSGCWSPKGKQIVFGFAEGKLQQFKPNLQPARAIVCPTGIHPGPFDCIAVHWLSTFQFAAIFLHRGAEACPSLFIVNAPKAGQPSYINYYDICYSAPGPRIHQLTFAHVAQWNLLLVISANGVEVGVVGTKETGETPNWVQYTLVDEARIEMPLTQSKDETYPLGFAIDTGSSHHVVIGERKLPVMPMIHVLSTHGHLVSYNFLNFSPNAVDICSPPPPLSDTSGQFVDLSETLDAASISSAKPAVNSSELNDENKQNAVDGFSNATFAFGSNVATSTPIIKDNPVPSFGTQPVPSFGTQPVVPIPTSSFGPTTTTTPTAAFANKPTTGLDFRSGTTATVAAPNPITFSQQFGSLPTGTAFAGFTGSGFSVKQQAESSTSLPQSVSVNTNAELNKPLYTVPATFTPPNVPQPLATKTEVNPVKPTASEKNKMNLNTCDIDEVVKQMIIIQMLAMETELNQIRQQSKHLLKNIGSPNEIKCYTKQLNELQEIVEEANDREFEKDVQCLRHSISESYAMLGVCRTKLDSHNNPHLTRLSTVSSTDATSRRQLSKLQSYVALNQNHFSQLNQLIDAQWAQYQDVVRRNSKNQMHVPCLDGVYQRMSKLKDLLSRQRTKMNYIKTKLEQRGLNYKPANDMDATAVAVAALTKNHSTMESLADSILSMSLSQVVSKSHAKLSEEKLNAIRNFTKRQQQIAIIKPKRPDRIGLKSEVILETKLETERKQREIAKKQLQQHQQQIYQLQYLQKQQQQQQQLQHQHQQQQQQQFAAYKTPINLQPSLVSKPQQHQNYQASMSQQLLKSQVSQQPILAKPTASKPVIVSSQPPTFITPTSSTAANLSSGGNSSFVKTSTTVPKSDETSKPTATAAPFSGFGMATSQTGKENNKTISTPISFSAKVIGGNDVKPFANFANKSNTQSNLVQATAQDFTAPATVTGFSAFATAKPAAQISSQDKDKTKKPEETSKQLSFAASATSASSATPAPPIFAGFAVSTKTTTTTTTAPFATPSFTTTAALMAFSALSSSTTFSTSATKASAPASASAVNITAKTVTVTASSSQGPAVSKSIETKPTTANTTPPLATTSTAAGFTSTVAPNVTASAIKSSAAPNVTITTLSLTENQPPVAATETSNNSPLSKADPTGSLFDSINICKPNTKETEDFKKGGNIFSGFAAAPTLASSTPFSFAGASGGADGSISFSSATSAGAAATTGFSVVSAVAGNAANNLGKSATVVTAEPAVSAAISASLPSSTEIKLVSVASTTTSTANSAATTATFSLADTATAGVATTSASGAAPTTSSTPDFSFGSLSVSYSSAASTTASNVTTTTSATTGNIFAGASSLFTSAATSTTTSLFGGGAAVASSAPSLFASTPPAMGTASGSIFGAAAAATTAPASAGSIFGGIPKPEQSAFSAGNTNSPSSGTGLFAAAAANSPPTAATGGSIFSGGSTTFASSTAGSIFGGGSTASPFGSAAPANAGGSIFSATAATNKPAEGGSIFGSPTQQSASSGGSLFSQPNFGTATVPQSTGSIFGGGNAHSPNSGLFGGTSGSIFAGSGGAKTSASGGSLFAPAAATAAPAFSSSSSAPAFGSFSQPSTAPAFGSPTAGNFSSPASTGFASPQQQSAFSKPLFGAPAAFGSPQPAFGAPPTFGGAPAFGAPKAFGSFAATSPTASSFTAAAASTSPNGNIFETLGSQDSGLSFGNLANATQPPQQKSVFGGSSFMNYRA